MNYVYKLIFKKQAGTIISKISVDDAAKYNQLNIIKYCHDKNKLFTTNEMNIAAANGHLEVIKWLHENRMEGCTTCAMDRAAENGHLDVVKWLHENRNEGCTTDAMDYAASNGYEKIICHNKI